VTGPQVEHARTCPPNTVKYTRELLTEVAAQSQNWSDMMRRLGREKSGGSRKHLQELVTEYGIDTGHFKQTSGWVRYSGAAITDAVARSTSMRDVALRLGATPASGTLSHLRRRIDRLRLDLSHFPLMPDAIPDLALDPKKVLAAAAVSSSIRDLARRLDLGDDSASRKALAVALNEFGGHLGGLPVNRVGLAVETEPLVLQVQQSSSFAEVMRRLNLTTDSGNHRKIRNAIHHAGIDTSHFTRRSSDLPTPRRITPDPDAVLVIRPPDSTRSSHPRLRRAMEAKGVAYACAGCGNPGEWRGHPITLQIDHISGDWLDNRQENLRFLCPNCHATTATWCAGNRGRRTKETRANSTR